MDLSTLANIIEVGAATCVAIKFLHSRAAAAFAGWEGEKQGLLYLWALAACVPVTVLTLTAMFTMRFWIAPLQQILS